MKKKLFLNWQYRVLNSGSSDELGVVDWSGEPYATSDSGTAVPDGASSQITPFATLDLAFLHLTQQTLGLNFSAEPNPAECWRQVATSTGGVCWLALFLFRLVSSVRQKCLRDSS